VQVGAREELCWVEAGGRWTGIRVGPVHVAARARRRRRGWDPAAAWTRCVVVLLLAPVYDPVARCALVRWQRWRRLEVRGQRWRRLEELLGRRVHRQRQLDLVEEAAEAARAGDVGGGGRHGAQGAAAHVAPVQAPPPPLPRAGAVRTGR
jgi:hypothetical protein